MNKTGKQGIQCTYCDKPALENTDPPVCADHQHFHKEAREGIVSLKELLQDVDIWEK